MSGTVQFTHKPVGFPNNGRLCICLFCLFCWPVFQWLLSGGSVFCCFLSFSLLYNQVKGKLTGNRSFSLKTTSVSQTQKNKGQANYCSKGQTMSPWLPLTADYWTVWHAGWLWFKDVNSQTLVVALEIYSHWWGVTEDQEVARQGRRAAPGSSLTCGFIRRFELFCSFGFKVMLRKCVLTVITTLSCAASVDQVSIYFFFCR